MTKMLVVEDDPAAAELLTLTLQRAGHEVMVVGSGAEALRSVGRGVKLVLLDLGLPDMDGLQACRELRERRPAIPILVVSARSSEADIVLALNAGADDYVIKPFRTQELLARVRTLLRRTNVGDSLFVGDVAIDSASFRASVEGFPLLLTPKEFEILTLLARNAGRIVPRGELQRQLWQTPLPGSSKSLDMHVSSLRRKLQSAGSQVVIRTSRGVGFALDG